MTLKNLLTLMLLATGLSLNSTASAGPLTDKLSACIIANTSKEDRTQLVKWMFSAAALHPAVKDIASVTPAQRTAANKDIAALFMRVLTNNCLLQAQAAIREEGNTALQTSFQLLGQVAGRELFSNPDVAKGTAELQQFLDRKKLGELFGSDKNAQDTKPAK